MFFGLRQRSRMQFQQQLQLRTAHTLYLLDETVGGADTHTNALCTLLSSKFFTCSPEGPTSVSPTSFSEQIRRLSLSLSGKGPVPDFCLCEADFCVDGPACTGPSATKECTPGRWYGLCDQSGDTACVLG